MVVLAIVVAWITFGGVAAAVLHRRALGPPALPRAVSAELEQYATGRGYEVIVMGNSSAISSHLMRRRKTPTSVPSLIRPATR